MSEDDFKVEYVSRIHTAHLAAMNAAKRAQDEYNVTEYGVAIAFAAGLNMAADILMDRVQ